MTQALPIHRLIDPFYKSAQSGREEVVSAG